jgi:hypothetical protein
MASRADFKLTKLRYITEESTFHNHRCDNLKSYTAIVLVSKTFHFYASYIHVLSTTFLEH